MARTIKVYKPDIKADKDLNMSGKGDKPRKVDQKKWAENWDRIFGEKKEQQEKDK